MNNQPAVSVIVPVYKAEAYLHRCVDSILTQTFTDFELLLIDDGSPDRSGMICDEYAIKDTRVRVFHKENGGVSSARQLGLDKALGEYVIHADPDDWVEPDMLEELYNEAKKENADMVICDYFNEYRNGKQYYVRQLLPSLDSQAVLQQLLSMKLHGSCWNKLVRRTCFINWSIRFPESIHIWEDLWVNCLLCNHDIHISYLNKALYHYDRVINSESIVRRIKKCYVEDQIRFCQYFSQLLKEDIDLSHRKFVVKINMFRSQFYEAEEIRSVFPEINEFILKEFGKKCDIRNVVPFCVSLVVRSKHLYLPARWLCFIVNQCILPALVYLKHLILALCQK